MPSIRRLLLFLLALIFLLLLLAVPGVSWADSLDDAARQLARKIVASLPPGEAVLLNVRNISSLPEGDVAAVRRALEAELQQRGVRLVPESMRNVEVRVTLSENMEGYVWIADFVRGEAPVVAIVALPRPRAADAPQSAPLTLLKELVWEQEEPILDLAVLNLPGESTPSSFVLEPSKVSLYGRQTDRWLLRKSFPLSVPSPWPRDFRGRLWHYRTTSIDSLLAYLPGLLCGQPVGVNMAAADFNCDSVHTTSVQFPILKGDEWATGANLSAGRNFLGPDLRWPWQHNIEPFFSATAIADRDGSTLYVLRSVDGHIGVYDQNAKLVSTFKGWGSELTSVSTPCGTRWQVLVTRPGDWTESDAIRAYEFRDRIPVTVSAPVEFAGPVTALWPAPGGSAATAVVRNLKTGRYEAYSLSVSCGH